MSASEAIWRIFKFPIQYKSTPVQRLYFHTEGKKPCYYDSDEDIEDVLERKANEDSQLTAWFSLNQRDAFAKTLLFAQIPKYYTWNGSKKQFNKRLKGFSLGRINYVPRKMEDDYYMRILLSIVPGPECFADLRTYRGVVYKTYKEACFARGILEDDQIYIDSLVDAAQWGFGDYLRHLFCVMILSGTLSRTGHVWAETMHLLSEDIEQKKRDEFNNPGLIHTLKKFKVSLIIYIYINVLVS